MRTLAAITLVFGVTVLAAGIVRLLMVPFGLAFEWRDRRRHGGAGLVGGSIFPEPPLVSVIVPGYNEAKVIEHCVRSVVRSRYPRFEVICVDDGSTDETHALMRSLAEELPHVRALTQANQGKGPALNTGINASRGRVLLLVDADGVFAPDTITEMVRAFDDETVGAVCGDDHPVNLDRVQTRFLALISHLGTGLMRRSLSVLRMLPIVSGNTGAYRREVIREIGGLRHDTLGEDLELTWRVHKAGYQVRFAPRALVYAESPSTLRGLWRQRVRWARGLLQTVRLHGGMIGNPRYGRFGVYLALNLLTQVAVPLIQAGLIVLVVVLAVFGDLSGVPLGLWAWVGFVGLPISVALLVLAVGLDRAWHDLRFAWTVPLWPVYSTIMSAVMLKALWLEMRGAESRWDKLDRSGVVSVITDPDEGSSS